MLPSVASTTEMWNKYSQLFFFLCELFSVRHWLDSSWEAGHREEEAVRVEVFKHALNRLTVDPEGDAGHTEVQAATHHILRSQKMLIGGVNGPSNAAWGHSFYIYI